MSKGIHNCCGTPMPDGVWLLCICMTCKHDNEDCCFNHNIRCPFGDREQVCEEYEREDEENDG